MISKVNFDFDFGMFGMIGNVDFDLGMISNVNFDFDFFVTGP